MASHVLAELAAHDAAFDAIESGKGDDSEQHIKRHATAQGWLDRIHPSGKTLLRCAVDAKNYSAITTLITVGASPLVTDQFGITPLHAACRHGDLAAVQALLNALPSDAAVLEAVSARDQEGSTALHTAAAAGDVSVVARLLRASANVHETDAIGSTPLHAAAEAGRAAVVEVLVAAAADPNASNSVGNTPLHRAARRGLADAVDMLCSLGADPARTNNDGYTPFDLAKKAAKAEGLALT